MDSKKSMNQFRIKKNDTSSDYVWDNYFCFQQFVNNFSGNLSFFQNPYNFFDVYEKNSFWKKKFTKNFQNLKKNCENSYGFWKNN